MRILALSSWWPEPADNGARLRVSNLLRALAREHEIHLVAFTQGPADEIQRVQTEQICASVRAVPQRNRRPRHRDRLVSLIHPEPASVRATWNTAFAASVQERAAAIQPDLVITFALAAAPYARLIIGVPRVMEELELTYMLEQYTRQARTLDRMRFWLTWMKHRRYITRLLAAFDACTVVSAQELRYAQQLAPATMPLAVIPNGADVDGCAGPWSEPQPDTLIYPGALSFDANHHAMTYFLRDIFPLIRSARPNTLLRITGKAEPEQQKSLPATDGVEFTGFVPDVRPVVASSWAEVVPLRKGGGTRLKILEALALGTPIVSTSKGVEGLELEHGKHLFVADSVDDFAAATLLLLDQPELRKTLVKAGQQAVRERYDWRVIGQGLNDSLYVVAHNKGLHHVERAA
ncbi:MAG: glycosyltransferase family 4 protein [Chloroflexales bacterium]|nr:glycosyltransferase family 4 protein [Chloroflexales bacterium]